MTAAQPPSPMAVDAWSPPTVDHLLQRAIAQGLPRLETQMLLLHTLGRPIQDRAWLLAHDQDHVTAAQQSAFQDRVERRLSGEPVAYLVGHKAFHGITLQVNPAVLDPRDDTETLVDWALELAPSWPPKHPLRVLDLGTGSGAVALALARALSDRRLSAEVVATDASAPALIVATANAHHLGLAVDLHQGNWWDALPVQTPPFDLIVSNPPYIAQGDPHLERLHHEPLHALVSGDDGLHDIRRIVAGAGAWLTPCGWLLLEHGYDQALAVAALLTNAGFEQVQTRRDLAGQDRCTGGRWPGEQKQPLT